MVYGAEDDKGAQFAWSVTADTLIYAANRIPEITDDIVSVDNAMKWGFAWDLGPFETWDAIGVAGVCRENGSRRSRCPSLGTSDARKRP